MKPKNLGKLGEDIAHNYFNREGYNIIDRNYRTKFGEIDIVTIDMRGILVFVEVKALVAAEGYKEGLLPEDNFSKEKIRKLRRICEFYANANPNLMGEQGWRIDLFTVTFGPRNCRVRHYKNL